jgi:CspA family cold shock protein
VPTGKVKWYSAEKGFGFISSDEGEDVYLHASALPDGLLTIKAGTRLEFGVADGRRGPQALSVRLIDPLPSVVEATRMGADDLAAVVEDVIKLLDRVGNGLRAGRRPAPAEATRVAKALRGVADQLDA